MTGNSGIAVIGHRGSSATHPENSLAAFQHAFTVGALAVELDVIPTADRVLAVAHDFVLENGADIALSQFASLPDALRLEEVLALAGGIFDIEMKSRPGMAISDLEYATLLLGAIRSAGVADRCMVRSFEPRLLRAMHRVAPTIPLAALTSNPLVNWVRYAKRAYAGCISPHYRLVSTRRTDRAHTAGLYVMPWTANDPVIWEKLIAAGVDGIITDDPAALIAYLKQRDLS